MARRSFSVGGSAPRLVRGAFWSVLGAVLSRGLGVVASIFVARLLGRSGMGQLGIVQSTVGIFSAFAGMGMGLTATKYVAQYRSLDPARAGAIIAYSSRVSWVTGLCMTGVMYLAAPWLATHTLGAPHLAHVLQSGSLLLLFGAVNGAQTGALSGLEDFRAIAQVNVLAGLVSFPMMLCGATWLGVHGAVLGLVASQAANVLLSHCALGRAAARASLNIGRHAARADWRLLCGFSLPGMLSQFVAGPAQWACSALLVNRPGGYSDLGAFTVTSAWFQAVTFLPAVLGQVVLPLLSSHSQVSDLPRAKKLLVLATQLYALLALPLVVLGCAASPFIMGWYGPAFRDEWPTLVLVLIGAGVLAMQGPASQQIIAAGRMWTYFLMHAGWAAALLILTALLVRHGAFGFALSRLLAYALNGVWVTCFAVAFLKNRSPAGLTPAEPCAVESKAYSGYAAEP